MIKLFVCLECGEIFSEPVSWKEDRGEYFGFPAYEELSGSPCCEGDYAEAYRCDSCGEWITDNYIKVGHQRYCQECYEPIDLGDEG
jgi:formylmethanofuran dehydrogenase subunit E